MRQLQLMEKPKLIIVMILLFYIIIHLSYGYWRKPGLMINSDVKEYYAYLPATFIYGDITLKFKETNPEFFYPKFWGHKLDNGNYVMKVTMGMAVLYSPFFLISHGIARITSWEADGYTNPYAAGLAFSSLLFFIAGLFMLRNILKQYFPDNVISVVLLIIALGTNIIQYVTKEASFPHSYNFFLFAAFVRLTQLWLTQQKIKYTLLMGIVLGLITLVRPTNGIIAFVFLFWSIHSLQTFKQRLILFLNKSHHLILIILICIIIWIPQLLYWKYITGSYLYYPYGEEGFFFTSPRIFETLFGFRKGWLLYTPVMILPIAGFFLMIKKHKTLLLSLSLFFILNLYVISSWWCWWYGGSYGNRAFIDSFVVLSIPLAAFIEHFFTKTRRRFILYGILALFVIHNAFQWLKYTNNAIHWDSMSKDAYCETLFKLRPTPEFFLNIIPPDYEHALKGLPERTVSLETKRTRQDMLMNSFSGNGQWTCLDSPMGLKVSTEKQYTKELMHNTSGNPFFSRGVLDDDNQFMQGISIPLGELYDKQINTLAAGYMIKPDSLSNTSHIGMVVSISNEKTDSVMYYHFESAQNPFYVHGEWFFYFHQLPISQNHDYELILHCYLWNIEGKARAEVNDFRIYGMK
jgi:hypothetical protein